MNISPIITVEELLKIYTNSDVMIFDASNSKEAKTNYEGEHLEGAFYIDLNTQLADIREDYAEGGRHPLPKLETFAKTLAQIGITNEKHIVIYDDKYGSNAAARFWWMLKAVGHEKVQVLNGGLNHAKKLNFPLSSKSEKIQAAIKPYEIDKWILPTIEFEEVDSITHNEHYLIVDVRDKERYDGLTEHLDLMAGHIPSAINIPFVDNLDHNGLILEPDQLRMKYEHLFGKVDMENIVVHCGSGVTACHTLLALSYAEMGTPKLYVGSWSEWSRNNKQIEKTDMTKS